MTDDIRQVARVLVINDQGEVYLLRGRDPALPDRPPFWFTPGGKIDDGETTRQAAARELFEEVGIRVNPDDLGDIIGTEDVDYHFDGVAYRQHGVFYAYRANEAGLNTSAWTELETRTIIEGRWWGLEEIRAMEDVVYPAHLAEMMTSLK